MQARFSHEIAVDLPMADALLLFTPKGEEQWVPGWKPRYDSPASGETTEGMLFTTQGEGETTYWTCLRWRPAEGSARYLRVVPESRMSVVDVACRSDGSARTLVEVSYEHFALTDEGTAYIEAVTTASFEEMIDGWAALIAARIQ